MYFNHIHNMTEARCLSEYLWVRLFAGLLFVYILLPGNRLLLPGCIASTSKNACSLPSLQRTLL